MLTLLLAPSSYADTEDYTFESFENVGLTVNSFCVDNYYTDSNGVLHYTVLNSFSDTVYPTFDNTGGFGSNNFTYSKPASCGVAWGISTIETPYSFGHNTYGYVYFQSFSGFFAGHNMIGNDGVQDISGLVNNTTWDIQVHNMSESYYELLRDSVSFETRFSYSPLDDFGDLMEFNFYTGDVPDTYGALYTDVGSTCRYEYQGVWHMGYFGSDSCPIFMTTTNQPSAEFNFMWAWSETADSWILEEGNSSDGFTSPEWDIIQGNGSDANADNAQLDNLSFSIFNPISGWLALFTDQQCVTLDVIPSWFGLSTTQFCTPWGSLRSVATPIMNIFGTMLLFAFAVSWLKGSTSFGSGPDISDLKYGMG